MEDSPSWSMRPRAATAEQHVVSSESVEDVAKKLTLGTRTERAREVARLAVHALCVSEHAEEEPSFAEEAVFLRASGESVRLGESADRASVVKGLEEGVGVRVGDVRLEAGVARLVVEPASNANVS